MLHPTGRAPWQSQAATPRRRYTSKKEEGSGDPNDSAVENKPADVCIIRRSRRRPVRARRIAVLDLLRRLPHRTGALAREESRDELDEPRRGSAALASQWQARLEQRRRRGGRALPQRPSLSLS